ncbi:hypothetical protein BJV82DRAFT_663754 [Fennellomyces sp. T-0311]|nr:hypothetical protein BJV82DRAFT_663754 [Fennellomyces sp. T-0311]
MVRACFCYTKGIVASIVSTAKAILAEKAVLTQATATLPPELLASSRPASRVHNARAILQWEHPAARANEQPSSLSTLAKAYKTRCTSTAY